jgi:hypothetical protein
MAAFRPEIFTIDEVLNFYDTAEGNDYKVYAGVNPSPQYLRYNFSGDKEIGRQELQMALTQLRNNVENYNPYLIQVISEEKVSKGRKKEPILTSISFQLNRPQQFLPMNQMSGVGSPRTEMLLEKLVEQNALMQSRLSALESIGEMEEEEEEPMSPINAMLSNPELQQTIITGIMGLVGTMFTKTGAPTGIAGIEDTDEALKILHSLMDKGVTIEHLRKLDEMNSMKLKSLLMML